MLGIDFEVHFVTEDYVQALEENTGLPRYFVDGRISLTSPGVEWFEPARGTVLARKCNDELAEVIQSHPDRFVGFAALAPNDPEAASDEPG